MKTDKKTLSFPIVLTIILVIYNVLFFAIPFPKSGAAWVEYVFSLLSIIGGWVSFYAFNKDAELRSKMYGIPVFRVGYIYMTTQLVFRLVICFMGTFVEFPVWITVVASVLVLGFSAIGVIAMDNARDVIEEQDEQVDRETKPMQTFRLDMQYIADSCKELKR